MNLSHSIENNELCPNCGNFTDQLDEVSGFCLTCNPSEKPPQAYNRIEIWLVKNADLIEERMLANNQPAKVVISEIMQQSKAVCLVCGSNIDHGTKDRHKICKKTPNCKKARRYYSYLKHEKGLTSEEALKNTVTKFNQEKENDTSSA